MQSARYAIRKHLALCQALYKRYVPDLVVLREYQWEISIFCDIRIATEFRVRLFNLSYALIRKSQDTDAILGISREEFENSIIFVEQNVLNISDCFRLVKRLCYKLEQHLSSLARQQVNRLESWVGKQSTIARFFVGSSENT